MDKSNGIYDLAARCEVGMGEACRRAGIHASTPSRWKTGTVPRGQQFHALKRAILEIAKERGTLATAGVDKHADGVSVSVQLVRRIREDAEALERELTK